MPSYLVQFSYNATAAASLVNKPTDRTDVVRKLAKKLGGKVVGLWMCFGEYDGVFIIEGVNNVSAAACAMAVTASGAFTKFRTTPLLTADEAMAAMKQSGSLGYTPPGA